MNMDTFLSRLGLGAVAALVVGIALNIAPGALFVVAASVLLLAIGTRDYRPRRAFGERTTIALSRNETMPLAA